MLVAKRRGKEKGLALFNYITWIMIIVMIYYIGTKLSTLMLTAETKQVLIMETKDYLTAKIKNILCNEILISDTYLTEDRLVRLSDLDSDDGISKKEKDYLDEVSNYIKNISDEYNREDIFNQIKKNFDVNILQTKKDNKTRDYDKFELYMEEYKASSEDLKENLKVLEKVEKSKDNKYMMNKFFTVDGNTSIDKNLFDYKTLSKVKTSIKVNNKTPQILIYHTHGSENYVDSKKGKDSDGVIGVGAYLKELLEDTYGYNVIHNTSKYDIVDGKWNRNAYDKALPEIEKIIRDNKDIELVIDLHRDSGKEKVVMDVDGKKVAKIMFFNGLSRSNTSSRTDLPNSSLKSNIAFSLAMQKTSMSMYKDFTKKVYLKGYRYNQHVAKKCMLVEVGNNKNTVKEAKAAMVLYAKILDKVLRE